MTNDVSDILTTISAALFYAAFDCPDLDIREALVKVATNLVPPIGDAATRDTLRTDVEGSAE